MKFNWKRIVSLTVFVLVVAGSAYYLIERKQSQLSKAPRFGSKPRPVTVAESHQDTFVESRSYLAEVEPSRTTRISPRVQATVDTLYVDENDRVRRGDPLVELDRREINRKISSLKNTVEQVQSEKRAREAERNSLKDKVDYWKKETKRFRRLARKDLVPEADLDKRQETLAEVKGNLRAAKETVISLAHRVESLRDQLSELRTRKSYYTIKSPYNARVTERQVDPGAMAKPGVPLLVLEDISGSRLVLDVPQSENDEIRAGQTVRFRDRMMTDTATISLVHPALDENHMLRAEVGLPENGDFRSGEYVPVEVVVAHYPGAVVIPRSALVESPDDRPYVYLVRDKKLVPRSVDPIGFTADQAAVDGLSENETVVKHTYLGWTRLNSGDRIQPVQ